MRLLCRQALALATLVSAAIHVQATTQLAEPASVTALEKRVKAYLQAFIDPNQTPQEQARFFADGAEYYRLGPSSRQAIVTDINRYVHRWPMRSYRLLNIEYLKPDPSSDDVFVSYVVEFDVANSNARVRGHATYGAAIRDIHTSPQIGMIIERIRNRDR